MWATFGPFSSIVDLGCAIGEFIAYFGLTHKVLGVGFDGSENSLIHKDSGATIFVHDLRTPINWGKPRFDLCMCLEVAEHIEFEFADILIDNCCSMSDLVLFTAAKPGQEGTGHVNLQPKEYWLFKFKQHGYALRSDKTVEFILKLEPWKHKKGIKAYYENAMVFEKWTLP